MDSPLISNEDFLESELWQNDEISDAAELDAYFILKHVKTAYILSQNSYQIHDLHILKLLCIFS